MNAVEKITELRESGLVVKVSHRRLRDGDAVKILNVAGVVRGEGGAPCRDQLVLDAAELTLRGLREHGLVPDTNGGVTAVTVLRREPVDAGVPPLATTVAEGLAVCSPVDNFNRRLGLTIALGRAVKAMEASS